MNDEVFIVWDNSRAEHGELPTLVDVFFDETKAREIAETEGLDPDEVVERRPVVS